MIKRDFETKITYTIHDACEQIFIEHLKERKIILNQDIDPSIIELVSMQILKWNEQDSEIPVEHRSPIKMYIYSGGGDVIAGLGLIDVMKSSTTPIHAYNMGICGSMAALIFICANRRFSYRNGTILLHDGSLHVASSGKKAKQTMEYYDKLDARLKQLVLDHTTITPQLYDEKSADEWFIFADESIEQGYGIVDELIS